MKTSSIKFKAFALLASISLYPTFSIADSLKANEFEGPSDERECILKMARKLMDGATGYSGIQLEKEVYTRRNRTETDEYTIYGSSQMTTPKDYKIQFKARRGELSNKLSGCRVIGDVSIVNSQGDKIVAITFPEYATSPSYTTTANKFPLDVEKEKGLKPKADFFKEKEAATPAPKGSIPFTMDKTEAKIAGAEAVGWYAAGKMFKSKTSTGVLKKVKMGVRTFFVLEELGHIKRAVEYVENGGEPKLLGVDAGVLDLIEKDRLIKGYNYLNTTFLEKTEVLKDPADIKKELEAGLVPHAKKDDKVPTPGATHDTVTITPIAGPSFTNQVPKERPKASPDEEEEAKRKARREALERLKKEGEK